MNAIFSRARTADWRDPVQVIGASGRIAFKVALILAILSAITDPAFKNVAFASAITATSLNVTSGSSPVASIALGTPVALTATVTSGATAVTPGTVSFCDATINTTCSGLAILGSAQLTSAGTATLTLGLGVGSHSLQAVFAGTNAYAGSTSSVAALTVTGKFNTATTISSAAGSTAGTYDLAALVSGFSPLTAAAPTGTVNFLVDGNSAAPLATVSLSAGTASNVLTFFNSSNPAVKGLLPSSAITGDFNGDGKLDAAVADNTDNIVVVFLGNGDGTFQVGATYPVGQDPIALATADVNNDGKLDLITANNTDSTISLLLGNGDGKFQAQRVINVPQVNSSTATPSALVVGDMNGDGKLDLILAFTNDSPTGGGTYF